MKYMLMMNCPRDGYDQFTSWPKKDIEAHIAFMIAFSKKLTASGEWVDGQGLAAPTEAKVVRAGKDGKPITDGVFPESKEFLAGYWIVDVESPQRAYELAAEASAAPGPGGAPFNMAIEVRQVMSGPPEDQVTFDVAGPSSRAAAARSGAAGARRDSAALPRLRGLRGRRAGSADRSGLAMAARRRSGQSARLADPGRVATHDGSRAQRNFAPQSRDRRRARTYRSSSHRPSMPSPGSIPTTRSCCSSCAAIRRYRPRRQSRSRCAPWAA